jgi:hypothetical protein
MSNKQASADKWAAPTEVDRITAAFPANVVGIFLPPWDEIPDEFRTKWHYDNHPWCGLVNKWFGAGLSGDEVTAKDGIDRNVAIRHLKACMGSFEPKHEHKIAGVAWLMSRWFDLKAA